MSKGWDKHSGRALALMLDNIDTDQLIPARFMSTPRSAGYGGFLIHDLRRDDHGQMRADFPLNEHQDVSVLVSGRNFGSGSSREAAVYALVDAGIKAVIAPSFGDIFAGNAINNGLLPARVSPEDWDEITRSLRDQPLQINLSLAGLEIELGGQKWAFSLQENWREKLVQGLDDIDLTLHHRAEIEAFKDERLQHAPWVLPG